MNKNTRYIYDLDTKILHLGTSIKSENTILVDLKPCPFCGSHNLKIHDATEYGKGMIITCQKCLCVSPTSIVPDIGSTVSDKIKVCQRQWNTRTYRKE